MKVFENKTKECLIYSLTDQQILKPHSSKYCKADNHTIHSTLVQPWPDINISLDCLPYDQNVALY